MAFRGPGFGIGIIELRVTRCGLIQNQLATRNTKPETKILICKQSYTEFNLKMPRINRLFNYSPKTYTILWAR